MAATESAQDQGNLIPTHPGPSPASGPSVRPVSRGGTGPPRAVPTTGNPRTGNRSSSSTGSFHDSRAPCVSKASTASRILPFAKARATQPLAVSYSVGRLSRPIYQPAVNESEIVWRIVMVIRDINGKKNTRGCTSRQTFHKRLCAGSLIPSSASTSS